MEPRVVRLSYKIEKGKLKELTRNTLIFQFIFERYKDVRKFGSVLENTQYWFNASASDKGNVRLLRITDLKDSGVRWEDVPFCQYENPEKHILKDKDILIARTWTIGKSFLVAGEIPDNTVFASYLIRLSPKKDILESEYAYLFLNSYYFWPQILEMKAGTAKININAEKIKSVDFPYCPPDIQKEIIGADFVRKYPELDDKIQNMFGLIDQVYDFERLSDGCTNLLSRLRSSILQDAIQGKLVPQDPSDEPASILLERIRKEKAELVKDGKIKKQKELPPISQEEIPFELPNGWKWVRLGEIWILSRWRSKHRPRNDPALFENGNIPFIQTGDVSEAKKNRFIITTVNGHYNEFGLAQSELHPAGTLCITIAANIAECWFLGINACLPDSIVCFKTQNETIKQFTFLLIRDAKEYLDHIAPSTAQKNINLDILSNLPIPLPPIEEQSRIIAKVDELMLECDNLMEVTKKSMMEGQKLLESVLGKMFNN